MEPEAGYNCGPTWCPEPVKYDGFSEGKNFWPELVGENGEVAAKTIQRENSKVEVIIVRPGDGILQDLRSDRVFVLLDPNDVVICAPTIG